MKYIYLVKSAIKNIILLTISLFLIYLFTEYSVKLYKFFYPSSGSGSIGVLDFTQTVVLALEYIFFISLIFTAFGDKIKYWCIGLLSSPIIVLVLYIDWHYVYVPILIGLVGWVLGFIVSKIISALKPR